MTTTDLIELMELIDRIKTFSGCDEVKLIGDRKVFDELIDVGFPLSCFKHTEINDELNESRLYIIPILK